MAPKRDIKAMSAMSDKAAMSLGVISHFEPCLARTGDDR